jgi:transposase-like protein
VPWVKQAEIDQKRDTNGPLTTEERQELARLRRDNKRLQMEQLLQAGEPRQRTASKKRQPSLLRKTAL